MHRSLLALVLLCVALAGAGGLSSAAAGPFKAGHCCPECHAICVPTPEQQTEKKHCWQVECRAVCIPAIKWPWQPCCEEPKCGKVRTVKVLKKVEYQCEHCGYKWEVRSAGCQCIDSK